MKKQESGHNWIYTVPRHLGIVSTITYQRYRPRPFIATRFSFQDLGYHGREMSDDMQVRGALSALGRSLAQITDLANVWQKRVWSDWICQADWSEQNMEIMSGSSTVVMWVSSRRS